ncbi:S41 family peptidase [Tunicatimonas pelagia]|uniref:S41 family peptidase n=1 Tax=Tunicatimonas pelagia TaxID=931531 RepID=UPI002666C4A3|nr:S41 family peptidase [Tunicatimonas pelagia]WKN46092.1 S41 family peptidase [Tunicatimonas pelagia]
MMKLVNGFLVAVIGLLAFASCEEVFIREEYDDNAVDVFNAMWTTVDENYSFFNFKGIDWDAVYEANRPRVENGMRRDSLFNVLADMLFVLRDGHVNLQAGFDLSRNWDWYLDFPQNFDFTVIERNYLADDYEITGPFLHRAIDSVGYIYYESFEDDFSESVVDYLVTLYASRVTGNDDTLIFKGLIIDVRDNGGGSLDNVNTLASRFADERRHVQNWQYKDGPGHNDFTDPIKKYIEPEGAFQYNGPVVVLTNRSCYSATNFFAQIMKNFPNVTVMGDSTGGGGGLPINRELPNGWVYRFSSTVTTTVAGENIEDGVAPDIRVDITDEDREAGRDTILEEALTEVDRIYNELFNRGA